ncbi:RimK/LysX family protein [uncultured Umboniibacter sp.]|uniref:ATP-dependent zinc protease family protein n=1 Tax=uncultured Umboniibacter sp. TaxID=1798917 RepID=UPI00260CAEDC|nr:RimK/LysX family protein [uncultured Umboniibacter sp.]
MKKIIIGHIENIDLPDLGLYQLTARVDSGAQTSSLHVDNISTTSVKGKPGVSFDIQPEIYNVDSVLNCKAVLVDVRKIKSSNGATEKRYVIRTTARLGEFSWAIEITLTDRSDMTYLMLLGRQAMGSNFYIDPSKAFAASDGLNAE